MDFSVFLMTFTIKNPWYFYVPAGMFVIYVLYLMVSGRRAERPNREGRGQEL